MKPAAAAAAAAAAAVSAETSVPFWRRTSKTANKRIMQKIKAPSEAIAIITSDMMSLGEVDEPPMRVDSRPAGVSSSR